jgi:hypothetical protein
MPMLHENGSMKHRLKLDYIECAFGIRVKRLGGINYHRPFLFKIFAIPKALLLSLCV